MDEFRELLSAGDVDGACAAARERISPAGTSKGDMFNIAAVFLEHGQAGAAAEFFEICVARFPDFAEAHLNLGIAYQKEGASENAITALSKGLALSEQHKGSFLPDGVGENYIPFRFDIDGEDVHLVREVFSGGGLINVFYADPEWIAARYVIACLVGKGDVEEAIPLYESHCLGQGKILYGHRMDMMFVQEMKGSAWLGALDKAASRLGCFRSAFSVNKRTEIESLRQKPMDAGYPSVLVNFLPRSGSTFVATQIRTLYGTPPLKLSTYSYPVSHVDPIRASFLPGGGLWCQEYLDATPGNVKALADAGIEKIYVQVRDPRAMVLSWHHFIEKLLVSTPELQIMLPSGYGEMSRERQIDWAIERHTKGASDFARAWLDCANANGPIDVMLLDYGTFARNPLAVVNDILGFFDVPVRLDEIPVETIDPLFQTPGKPLDWRDVFTKDQIERSGDLIDDDLSRYFGWND